MELRDATHALAALGNEHRLAVFRLLVRHGASGLPAGRVAEALGMPASSLSFHLSQLSAAGLSVSHRRQRQIIYAVDIERMRRLLAFLTEDCCGGHPEICGDLARPFRDANPVADET